MAKKLWNGLANVFAFLLVLSIAAGAILESYRSEVDKFFDTVSSELVTSEDGETYSTFLPDAEFLNADGTGNARALITKAIDIGRRHETEGAVLLKNENNVLPLAKGSSTKVTLLGARSHRMLINSSMGQKSQGGYISFEQALSASKTDFATTNAGATKVKDFNFSDLKLNGDGVEAGAGWTLNPTAIDAYQATSGNMNIQQAANKTYTVGEPAVSALTAAQSSFVDSFKQYNDAAIVVFGRGAGESNDYWKGGLAASEKTDTITEPLQLTKNELDILNLAKQNFDKVIVLLNCNSAIEIGDLKNDPQIDAIMWIGNPGNYGTLGIADVLVGNVSPSGGLYDIYATKNLSAPAMANMGQYEFTNYKDGLRSSKGRYYVMESESIYTGYRYYETRYFDTVYNQGNSKSTTGAKASSGGWDYKAEVAYGFGYGLSYTTFSFDSFSLKLDQKPHTIYATATVKVTNTGKVAGRTPVQIYAQAPYTDYDKQHKVEKAAIQLLNFGKTKLLKPGESETVTVDIDLQNLASYDSTWKNSNGTEGTYILDNGSYYFTVGNGAHDALNNVLAKQGKKVADGMDYDGKANLVHTWDYKYAGTGTVDGTTFALSKTNEQIQNQIPYIDPNYFGMNITHLSRQDWQGTWPVEDYKMTAPQMMLDYLSGAIVVGEGKIGEFYTIAENDDVSDIIWDAEKKYSFFDMVKSDYDDPRWETLLNQLNLANATNFAALAGPCFFPLPEVDFVAGKFTENAGNGVVTKLSASNDKNAPWAILEGDDADWNPQVFGCAPLVASSFDHDLMYEIGNFVGNEALFVGQPIVWGPGLNTHRHAYNGRNGEYYSEDPVLSAYCALEWATASATKGLIAAPKHFVFNDQETQRNGVAPFMTEQRAREIELRAFQIGVEHVGYEGNGIFGLMTSFSKVGPVEVTNSWGMLTGILQQEWGFHGYAVTDINDDTDLFTGLVYAGCTGYDNRGWNPGDKPTESNKIGNKLKNQATTVTGKITVSDDMFKGDATMQRIVKTSVHRTLWAFAHSNVMNYYSSTPPTVREIETSWRIMYKTLIGVSAALTGVCVVLYAVSSILKKKEDK